MKIKTKLHLIITAIIILFAGIVSVSLLWQKQTAKHLENHALFEELNQAIFERALLREEYFLYREDRSKEQFLLIHKQVGGLLERMQGTFTGLEEKASLIKMMGFHKKIEGFFNRLVRLDQGAAIHTATAQALRERIISQMLVNTDSMYRESLRLLNEADEKAVHQNNLAHLYSNIVFGLLALFIVAFAVIIRRSMTYPLTQLHKGTEIVAGGNLDYKTNIRTPDEIGQLSTAFDAMTENLKKITVSRDELSKEISTRKQAEEELRESQEQLQFVTDHAPVSIAQLDHEQRYKFVNHSYAEMFGLRPVDIIGKHPRDILGEEAYAQASPHMEAVFAGQPTEYDIVLPTTPSGPRIVHVAYAPERDASGRFVGFIAAISDITELKRVEEEKRRLEERSHKLIEDVFRFIPEGILVFSRKMELLRQNQAFRELVSGYAKRLGFAEDELENLIVDKIMAAMEDRNIKEIRIARKHETGEKT